jgi:hypothetical protein
MATKPSDTDPDQEEGARRADLLERLELKREHPEMEPFEKETAVTVLGDSDTMVVSSFRSCVYRRFLHHPAFSLKWLNIYVGNQREITVDSLEEAVEADGFVVGVCGELPVGALTIRSEPRKSGSHSDIVSHRVLED